MIFMAKQHDKITLFNRKLPFWQFAKIILDMKLKLLKLILNCRIPPLCLHLFCHVDNNKREYAQQQIILI